MKKRVLSSFLILLILMTSLNIQKERISFAYSIDSMRSYIQSNFDVTDTSEATRNAVISYMRTQMGETQFVSQNTNYRANMGILVHYGVIAYTPASNNHFNYIGMEDGMYDDNGVFQYRYFGWIHSESEKITNPEYPNVSGSTNFFESQGKDWKASETATKSWDALSTTELSDFMLQDAGLWAQDDGKLETNGTTLPQFLSTRLSALGLSPSIGTLKSFATFGSAPTTILPGTFHMEHVLNGTTWTRSVYTDPVPFPEPDVIVSFDKSKYEFSKDELTKTLTGTATVQFPKNEFINGLINDNWMLGNYIESATITVNGEEEKATIASYSYSVPFSIPVSRYDFNAGVETDYTLDVDYHHILQDIFLSDNYLGSGSGSTTVMVNAGEVNPYFEIHVGTTDYTDGDYPYKAPFTNTVLRLIPNNTVLGNNTIKRVVWKLHGTPIKVLEGNKEVNYTITPAMLSTHTNNGLATIDMTVYTTHKFDNGGVFTDNITISHTVNLLESTDPIIPQDLPPVAKLRVPSEVRKGDKFKFSGAKSYDPDGEIVDYHFWGSEFEIVKMYNDYSGKGVFIGGSSKDLRLRVKDNDDLTDTDEEEIIILDAIEASMAINGIRKVNRKVIFDFSSSIHSDYYPIDDYTLTITPLEGQSASSIKYETNNKGIVVNTLFKEAGAYQATLDIHATCTYPGEESNIETDTVSFSFTIQPDLAPVASLAVSTLALRDMSDNGLASIRGANTSYSPDGDQLEVLGWYEKFDSDNDGSFDDETATYTKAGEELPVFKNDHVGMYDYDIVVREVIPADQTISKFLTASDYLTDDSLDNDSTRQQCEVDNVAPTMSLNAKIDKEVDILIITDETGNKLTDLASESERMRKGLSEMLIRPNLEFININADSAQVSTVGTKKEQTFEWKRYYSYPLHYKYYVKRDGSEMTYKDNVTLYVTGEVETRTGTPTQMASFPIYPDAYVKYNYGGGVTYDNGTYSDYAELTPFSFDIYNAPNDYLKTVGTTNYMTVGRLRRSTEYYSYSNGDNHPDGTMTYTGFMNINFEPVIGTSEESSVSDWQQASIVSTTDKTYDALELENYISSYADSDNDKILIFAIGNGENFFLTEEQRSRIINEYGFKVYFSINDFWGEFSPDVSDVVDVRFSETGGFYGLTKYGNEVINESTAPEVYYSNKPDAVIDDYKLSLGELGFDTLSPTTSSYNTYYPGYVYEGSFTTAYDSSWWGPVYTDGMRTSMEFHYLYQNNASVASKNYHSNGTYQLLNGWYDEATDTPTIDVKTAYTNGASKRLNGTILEGVDGKFYYMYQLNWRDAYLRELDIDGIDAVYAKTYSVPNVFAVGGLDRDKDYSNYTYDRHGDRVYASKYEISGALGIAEIEETMYIIKDSGGGYLVVKGANRYASGSADWDEDTPITLYPSMGQVIQRISSLDKLYIEEHTVEPNDWYNKGSGLFDEKFKFTRNGAFAVLSNWQYTDVPPIDVWNFQDDHVSNSILPISASATCDTITYSLVNTDGQLIVDDKVRASNVYNGANNGHMVVYTDTDFKVYGYGDSQMGALGHQGDNDTFAEILKSPYTLNEPYASSNYDCIFDFSSLSPAYSVVGRGEYDEITQAVLDSYADYTVSDTLLLQKGDPFEMNAFYHDFEQDPAYDFGLDIVQVPGHFDNEEGLMTIPSGLNVQGIADKAGKFLLTPWAIDDPIGVDEAFADYRYRNRNNYVRELIVHRKPYAVLGYELVPLSAGRFYFVPSTSGSYDLDHSISRADKGIADEKLFVKKEFESTWTEFTGQYLIEPDIAYQFALSVQDIEGAWSDYDIKSIEISGEPFIMNASIDPAYPSGVPAGGQVTVSANIVTTKVLSSVTANIDGTIVTLTRTSQSGMTSNYSGTYTVRTTKVDKNYYDVTVTATASDGVLRRALLKLNVCTPLNLTGNVDPYEIKKGQVGTITAQTSKYATSCYVDLFYGTSGQGRVWLNRTSVSGDLATWSKTYTFDSNMPEGVYNAVFVASTANGNSESVTDTFAFIPNQPPLVTIESVQPSFIYEGDDVTLNCQVQDPDLDTLSIVVEMSQDGGVTWTVHSRMEDFPVTHLSGQAFQVRFENVTQTAYLVRVTATDPLGAQGQSSATFSAAALSVTGAVHHTEKWNENRMLFNRAKTGSDDAPRPYKTFWPGEKLVLEGQTTQIDNAATTFCTQVRVHIEGKNGVSSLLSEKNASLYTGEMWTEEMLDWKTQTLCIVFEAAFSNGVVKSHTVEIRIDNSEPYWQHHKLF